MRHFISFDLVSFSAVLASKIVLGYSLQLILLRDSSEFSASCQRCTPSKVVEFQAASMFLAEFAFLPRVFVFCVCLRTAKLLHPNLRCILKAVGV